MNPVSFRPHRFATLVLVLGLAFVLSACQGAPAAARTLTFRTLNDSGVAGTVSFREVSGRT